MRLPLRPPPSATPFSPQAPPFSHAAAPDEAEDDDDDSDYNPEDHPYEPAGSFDAEMDDAKPVSVYELLALRGYLQESGIPLQPLGRGRWLRPRTAGGAAVGGGGGAGGGGGGGGGGASSDAGSGGGGGGPDAVARDSLIRAYALNPAKVVLNFCIATGRHLVADDMLTRAFLKHGADLRFGPFERMFNSVRAFRVRVRVGVRVMVRVRVRVLVSQP